jgi:hypothetical protein
MRPVRAVDLQATPGVPPLGAMLVTGTVWPAWAI